MTFHSPSTNLLVSIPEAIAFRIMSQRITNEESIADVIGRLLDSQTARTDVEKVIEDSLTSHVPTKHRCDILGRNVYASSFGELFGKVVDLFVEIAPEVVEIFATKKMTKRRYLSRNKNEIHPGSPHLPVAETVTGWWVSKNVSQKQTESHLLALCEEAGLKFGSDVKLRSASFEQSEYTKK